MKTHKKRRGCDKCRAPRGHQNGSGQHGQRLHDIPRKMPDELAETVADRLKRSLRFAGISQYEMAAYLELHRNAVGGYVTGKTKMLPGLLRLWADKTGVPADWIKTGTWPKADA